MISKSQAEDKRILADTTSAINHALVSVSLGDTVNLDQIHKNIYTDLKNEADRLVSLGRADASLFERWFIDIETEFNKMQNIEVSVRETMPELSSSQEYKQKRAFQTSIDGIKPAKESLLRINQFLYELENVISEKR